MVNKEQKQIGGNYSDYIQVGRDSITNNIIIEKLVVTNEDFIKISNGLFKQNSIKFSDIPTKIAMSRTKTLVTKFLDMLSFRNPEGINQVNDPDFQYDLFIAQREYARCGDPRLAYMLISLLVERTKETKRSLCQIVLNESITVVPKLTIEEIDTLTVLFVMMHHIKRIKFNNTANLANYITTHILPFCNSLEKEVVGDGHLIYTGCGSHIIYRLYDLDKFLNSLNISNREELSNLINTLNSTHTNMKLFFDLFNNDLVNHIFLTSVGVAIGYANLCRVTDEDFELSEWIY